MGIISSKESPPALELPPERPESVASSKMHGRQASVRQSTIRAKSKQPMPDPNELERRFTKVLVSYFLTTQKPVVRWWSPRYYLTDGISVYYA